MGRLRNPKQTSTTGTWSSGSEWPPRRR